MSDTSDNLILTASINDPGFQTRCRLRFINAAISISTEVTSVTTNGSSGSGVSLLHMSGTAGLSSGMTVTSLFSPNAIPVGTVVESTGAGTVTLNNNLTGAIISGDSISFAPVSHSQKLAFAGALFAGNVDLKMLASAVLSNSTNRGNCIAGAQAGPGGNILDNDIDFQVNSVFAGIATSRSWS